LEAYETELMRGSKRKEALRRGGVGGKRKKEKIKVEKDMKKLTRQNLKRCCLEPSIPPRMKKKLVKTGGGRRVGRPKYGLICAVERLKDGSVHA